MKKTAVILLILSMLLSSACLFFPEPTTGTTAPRSEIQAIEGSTGTTTSETTNATETTTEGFEYTAYGYTFTMPVRLQDYVYTSPDEPGEIFALDRLADDLGWRAYRDPGEITAYNILYYFYVFNGNNGKGKATFALTNTNGINVQMGEKLEIAQLTSYSIILMNTFGTDFYWQDQDENPEHGGYTFNISAKAEGTVFYKISGCFGDVVASWEDIVMMAYSLYGTTTHPGVCPLLGTAIYEDGLKDGDPNFSF